MKEKSREEIMGLGAPEQQPHTRSTSTTSSRLETAWAFMHASVRPCFEVPTLDVDQSAVRAVLLHHLTRQRALVPVLTHHDHTRVRNPS